MKYLEKNGFKKGKKGGIWTKSTDEGRQMIDLREGVKAYSYDGAATPKKIAEKVKKLMKKEK